MKCQSCARVETKSYPKTNDQEDLQHVTRLFAALLFMAKAGV